MTRRTLFKNLELRMFLLMLASIAILTVGLYFLIYNQYQNLIIEGFQNNAAVVHQYAEDVLDESSFYELNTRQDEETELYQTIHEHLDEIRHIANILYLYTAKRNDAGELIYVVDGLDKDDEMFRHVGDLIEDEIIPDLEKSLDGEIVFGDAIMDTEWGIVYTAFFPFSDSAGNVIGAIGMEFECEEHYNAEGRVRMITSLVAFAMSLVFLLAAFLVVRRIVNRTETAFINMEKEKIQAEELMEAITDASPFACHIWDSNLNIIDCNEAAVRFFGYRDKQELFERWKVDASPEYQPDGMKSITKALGLVERAFADGYCDFEWMHQSSEGSPMPVEVILVRVKYAGDNIVAGYLRDLRIQKELERRAGEGFFDELTGVYNKKYMDERLSRVMRIMSRAETTLTMMMVDVDKYRGYCKSYGTDAGEDCLKAVANTIKKHARRADDFVARVGDDIFVVALPNTDKVGAKMIAKEMLISVRSLKIPHDKGEGENCVTVSIGVTTGNVYHRQLADDYIKRADEMLYASKHSGQDRYTYCDL